MDNWIKVEDKLPAEWKTVIASNAKDGTVFPAKCSSGNEPAYWNDLTGSYRRVTHWMPLPEAPNGN